VHAPNQSWLLIFLISSFGVARLRSSPDHSRLEVRMRRTSKSNSPGADLRLTRIIYGGNLIDVEIAKRIGTSRTRMKQLGTNLWRRFLRVTRCRTGKTGADLRCTFGGVPHLALFISRCRWIINLIDATLVST
jgi:hypothetical protein